MVLLAEDVRAKRWSLHDIVREISDVVQTRSDMGKEFGTVVVSTKALDRRALAAQPRGHGACATPGAIAALPIVPLGSEGETTSSHFLFTYFSVLCLFNSADCEMLVFQEKYYSITMIVHSTFGGDTARSDQFFAVRATRCRASLTILCLSSCRAAGAADNARPLTATVGDYHKAEHIGAALHRPCAPRQQKKLWFGVLNIILSIIAVCSMWLSRVSCVVLTRVRHPPFPRTDPGRTGGGHP